MNTTSICEADLIPATRKVTRTVASSSRIIEIIAAVAGRITQPVIQYPELVDRVAAQLLIECGYSQTSARVMSANYLGGRGLNTPVYVAPGSEDRFVKIGEVQDLAATWLQQKGDSK